MIGGDVDAAREELCSSAVLQRARQIFEPEILAKCDLSDTPDVSDRCRFDSRQQFKLIMRMWFAHVLLTQFRQDSVATDTTPGAG